jgi:hypothetical protein
MRWVEARCAWVDRPVLGDQDNIRPLRSADYQERRASSLSVVARVDPVGAHEGGGIERTASAEEQGHGLDH